MSADDLCGLLRAEGAEHLAMCGMLQGKRLHEVANAVREDRPAFLADLKRAGIATVGARQRVANALSRWAREHADSELTPPPPPPMHPNDSIPIVYIHVGARPYVEAAIRVTRHFHRGPMFVLGDVSMRAMLQAAQLLQDGRVSFVNVNTLQHPQIERARRCYVHRSSNDARFEFFCFERIFLLHRFLQAHRLQRVMHLDSDCVLLAPLAAYPLERHAVWLVNNDFYQEHGDCY